MIGDPQAFRVGNSPSYCRAVFGGGGRVALGWRSGVTRLWDLTIRGRIGFLHLALKRHEMYTNILGQVECDRVRYAFSGDGNRICIGSADGNVIFLYADIVEQ